MAFCYVATLLGWIELYTFSRYLNLKGLQTKHLVSRVSEIINRRMAHT